MDGGQAAAPPSAAGVSTISGYRVGEGPINRSRVIAVMAVIAVHLALGFALLRGLGVLLPHAVGEDLTVIDVRSPPAPPPERIAPRRRASPRKAGAASPPNLRAKATEVVAPPPILPPVPPPMVAALVAGTGSAEAAGAAPVRGPGSGSGGIGDGTGSGGAGNGDGGGGGTPLRLLSGRLTYPKNVPERGRDETVGIRFIVGVKGRVTDCVVTEGSGNVPLDQIACDLIKRHLRYRPETDRTGRPVPVEVVGSQTWQYDGRTGESKDEN